MERHLIELIKTKKFIELTSSERAILNEWVQSEDEFEAMKFLYVGMDEIIEVSQPADNVKKSLDKLFFETHPQPSFFAGILLFLFPPQKEIWFKPGFQIGTSLAFALIIFFSLLPAREINKDEVKPLTAELKKEENKKQKIPVEEKSNLSISPKVNIKPMQDIVNQSALRSEISMTFAESEIAAETSVGLEDIHEDFVIKTIENNLVMPTMQGNENLLDYLSATY